VLHAEGKLSGCCCVHDIYVWTAKLHHIYNTTTQSMTCGGLVHDGAMSDVHTQQKSRSTGLTSNLLHVPINIARTIEYCMMSAEA